MARKKPRPVARRAKKQDPPVLPGVNPVVPGDGRRKAGAPFPIVCIGASAGGLGATIELLRQVPVETGMAFVVVLHLAPTHQSILAEIFSRETLMPVYQAQHHMA